MSETDLTADEVFESLTGFDELAIAHNFGDTILNLGEKDSSMFGRALVFIVKRRGGATDDEARNAAMELGIKAVNADFFAKASTEEPGKDVQPSPSPETSPTSVS